MFGRTDHVRHLTLDATAMFQLVYSSTATRPLSEEELQALLATARQKNDQAGLTGLLLYKDGSFIQCLEGDRSAVKSLMAKIAKDPRLKDVKIMVEGDANGRDFMDWSMGFKRVDGSHSAPFEEVFKTDGNGKNGTDGSAESVPKLLLRLYYRAKF
jgi:hypothetical protein